MTLKDLLSNIQKSVEELDLVQARKYIEENLDILQEKRSLLHGNARELLDILASRKELDLVLITKAEMATLHALNSYSSRFDLRSIKLTIKGKEQLLLRKDIKDYLNSDAKIVLQSMGALNG
ncbi:hypothetical protein JOC77_001539 [Peribacillus deserti]|uniref:Flagellar protein FlgN n=1 Tax=Peribacillus deserti TaxID=673318 RepID=A0ABS2QG93_9BACI|nr:hypothetical protein [Peribacillus deserti]MBM7692112.1 hypothetical protein [Peribacillus deserti]